VRPNADLAELDAMLEATLAALRRRAEPDADCLVSFGVGDPGATTEVDELWRLVEHARGAGEDDGESLVSFGAGEHDEGMLARAKRECSQLIDGLLSSLAHPHVIETGEGRTRIRTRVGWLGDTSTHVEAGAPPAELAAHVAALQASLATSAHRLRLLAMVVTAASKIAPLIATPAGAVIALPIAYKCVRDIHQRWSGSGAPSNTRGMPWS
jgi:hypothetical protein